MHACLQEEEEEDGILLRRRLQAFYNCEEDDLREIVSTIVANRIIGSTLQRQSVWIVPVLQGFYFPPALCYRSLVPVLR